MARLARVIVPEVAHHVTQRGNRRQTTFFREDDYRLYLAHLAEWSAKYALDILAYCLMPNHIHLVAVPPDETALTKTLSEVHRRYTQYINKRENWRGHLWQGRFASFPLSPAHLHNSLRYVAENPVRARLTQTAEEWPWSSAHERLHAPERGILSPNAHNHDLKQTTSDGDEVILDMFHRHERTGRPLGDAEFVAELERRTKRTLAKRKPGPKT